MTTDKMFLHKKDIKEIQSVLEKFPDVETFELDQEGGNGIGTFTTMTFDLEINGLHGSFKIEISGVEDW
jgi:hypothetical protein